MKSTIWRKLLVVVAVVAINVVIVVVVIVTSVGIVIVVRLVAREKDLKNGMRAGFFWPADHPTQVWYRKITIEVEVSTVGTSKMSNVQEATDHASWLWRKI